jgi:hypothetical protein
MFYFTNQIFKLKLTTTKIYNMTCPKCYDDNSTYIEKTPYKLAGLLAGICFIGASLTMKFSDMIWGIGIGAVAILFGKFYKTNYKKCNSCGNTYNQNSGF